MTKERLYTMILDYRGGTYVSQVTESTPEGAVLKWLQTRADHDLADWGLTSDDMEVPSDEYETPSLLEGCVNVWCVSGIAQDHLMLFNIVATDVSA